MKKYEITKSEEHGMFSLYYWDDEFRCWEHIREIDGHEKLANIYHDIQKLWKSEQVKVTFSL